MDPQSNQQANTNLPESISPVAPAADDDSGFEQSFEINHSPNTSIPNIAQVPLAPSTSMPHGMTVPAMAEVDFRAPSAPIVSETHPDNFASPAVTTLDQPIDTSSVPPEQVAPTVESSPAMDDSVQPEVYQPGSLGDQAVALQASVPAAIPQAESINPSVLPEMNTNLSPAVSSNPMPVQSSINFAQQPPTEAQLGTGPSGADVDGWSRGVEADSLSATSLGQPADYQNTMPTQAPAVPASQDVPFAQPAQPILSESYFDDSGAVSGVAQPIANNLTQYPSPEVTQVSSNPTLNVDTPQDTVTTHEIPTQDSPGVVLEDSNDAISSDSGFAMSSHTDIAPVLSPDTEPEDLFKSTIPEPPKSPSDMMGITSQVTESFTPNSGSLQFIQPSSPANPFTSSLDPVTPPLPPIGGVFPNTSIPPGLSPSKPGATNQPSVMPNTGSTKSKALPVRKIMIGLLVLAVLVVAGFVVKGTVFDKIKKADVDKALANVEAIDKSITDMQSKSVTQVVATEDEKLIQENQENAKKQISDAQKQYDELKKSKVVKLAVIQTKFDKFSKEWTAYHLFISNSVDDIGKIEPPIINGNKKILQASTTPDYDKNRTQAFIKSLESSRSTVKDLKLKSSSFRQIQNGYVSYLDAIIKLCKPTLDSGKYEQCFNIPDTVSSPYTKILQDSAQAANTEEFNLTPSDSVSALRSSIQDYASSFSGSSK